MQFKLNTGAEVNILPRSLCVQFTEAPANKSSIFEKKENIFQQSKTKPIGEVHLSLHGKKTISTKFYVVDHSSSLLGLHMCLA